MYPDDVFIAYVVAARFCELSLGAANGKLLELLNCTKSFFVYWWSFLLW